MRTILPVLIIIAVLLTVIQPVFAQTSTGQVCIQEFEDLNQNGELDTDEPALEGLIVTLEDPQGNVFSSLTTTLTADCINDVPDGSYLLTIRLPDDSQLTTAQFINLTIRDGSSITIDAGVIVSGTARSNEICVEVFEDLNQNGEREADEKLLPGVNILLLVDDVVVETEISNQQGDYCFIGLGEGAYRVVIPQTERYRINTRNDASPTFIGTGSRFTIAFGGVLLNPFTENATLTDIRGERASLQLDQESRLLLATMGSGIVLLMMIGVGAIIMGLMRR